MECGESIFIKCHCGCNVLEFNSDDELKNINIAIWVNHPGVRPFSKKERIRWCDYVMKTGMPWADHTIVNIKDAQKIVKFLNKYIILYGTNK